MNEIGVGIIGAGFGRRVQAPAFAACEGAKLISICSGNIENAEAAAKDLDIGHFTSDWRETASHPDVQLVCITTPPILHREMVLFTIDQGKSVICEKPMAMSVAEAEEMAAASAGKPILAIVDHELRFLPGRQAAYRMLREGAIGDIRHAKVIFQAPHRGDPALPWNWWSDKTAGGGGLGAIASHIIDSFQWLLDTDIATVFAQLHTHIGERRDSSGKVRRVTSDDESMMVLRFKDSELTSNATGLVSISMVEYPHYENRLEFYGTKGAMRISCRGELQIAGVSESEWAAVDVDIGTNLPGAPDTGFSRGFMAFAPELIKALAVGSDHVDSAATFADGVRVQRVLDAARESDRSGQVVSIA